MLSQMNPTHRRAGFWQLTLFLSLATGAAVALAQQPPAASGEGVIIDFLATANDGRPVPDLKTEEISLRVDGRQRPVKSLKLVQVGAMSGASDKPAADPPPAPFAMNTASDASRSLLFAVEDASIKTNSGRAVKDAILQFMKGAKSTDRIGLVTLPQPTVRAELGSGNAAVRDAAEKVSGRAPASSTTAEDSCRTRDTLEALRNVLGGLAGAESPTTVVVFSGGLIGSTRSASQTGSGACDLTTEHFLSVGRASSAGRAHLYVIQAEETVTTQSDGLESLAGVTGGQVLRLAVAGESPIDRAARETSAYYLASFDPDPKERDGQDHRLEVRLSRSDVHLRSRTVLTIPKGDARGSKSSGANPRDMVKNTAAYRDLPLRVAAYPSRGSGDKIGVLIMAEPTDPGVKLTAASAAIVDGAGRASTTTFEDKQLASRPIMTSLAGSPGTYRVRFAATDSSGRSGAVDYTVNAELTPAGPLKMSGLVIFALRDKSMSPAMQFRDEATAVGYVEIYGQLTGQISARMEVAASVDGPALKTIQPGGQTTAEADKVLLLGEIPIADLKPGDYVVRAFVSLQGQPEGRVVRTLRKVQ